MFGPCFTLRVVGTLGIWHWLIPWVIGNRLLSNSSSAPIKTAASLSEIAENVPQPGSAEAEASTACFEGTSFRVGDSVIVLKRHVAEQSVEHIGYACADHCTTFGLCSYCGAGACCSAGSVTDPGECEEAVGHSLTGTFLRRAECVVPRRHGIIVGCGHTTGSAGRICLGGRTRGCFEADILKCVRPITPLLSFVKSYAERFISMGFDEDEVLGAIARQGNDEEKVLAWLSGRLPATIDEDNIVKIDEEEKAKTEVEKIANADEETNEALTPEPSGPEAVITPPVLPVAETPPVPDEKIEKRRRRQASKWHMLVDILVIVALGIVAILVLVVPRFR